MPHLSVGPQVCPANEVVGSSLSAATLGLPDPAELHDLQERTGKSAITVNAGQRGEVAWLSED